MTHSSFPLIRFSDLNNETNLSEFFSRLKISYQSVAVSRKPSRRKNPLLPKPKKLLCLALGRVVDTKDTKVNGIDKNEISMDSGDDNNKEKIIDELIYTEKEVELIENGNEVGNQFFTEERAKPKCFLHMKYNSKCQRCIDYREKSKVSHWKEKEKENILRERDRDRNVNLFGNNINKNINVQLNSTQNNLDKDDKTDRISSNDNSRLYPKITHNTNKKYTEKESVISTPIPRTSSLDVENILPLINTSTSEKLPSHLVASIIKNDFYVKLIDILPDEKLHVRNYEEMDKEDINENKVQLPDSSEDININKSNVIRIIKEILVILRMVLHEIDPHSGMMLQTPNGGPTSIACCIYALSRYSNLIIENIKLVTKIIYSLVSFNNNNNNNDTISSLSLTEEEKAGIVLIFLLYMRIFVPTSLLLEIFLPLINPMDLGVPRTMKILNDIVSIWSGSSNLTSRLLLLIQNKNESIPDSINEKEKEYYAKNDTISPLSLVSKYAQCLLLSNRYYGVSLQRITKSGPGMQSETLASRINISKYLDSKLENWKSEIGNEADIREMNDEIKIKIEESGNRFYVLWWMNVGRGLHWFPVKRLKTLHNIISENRTNNYDIMEVEILIEGGDVFNKNNINIIVPSYMIRFKSDLNSIEEIPNEEVPWNKIQNLHIFPLQGNTKNPTHHKLKPIEGKSEKEVEYYGDLF